MAIVKAPLFSLAASGQLAKSLVYLNWKGIKDVRQHVIPANPRTTAQQAQRSKLTGAVSRWHTYEFSAMDTTAIAQLASVQANPMSGFNAVCKLDINAQVAGDAFQLVTSLATSVVSASGFTVAASGRTAGTYKIRYGTSPVVMTSTGDVDNNAGALSSRLANLSAGVKYYFQIYAVDEGHADVSGIGTQTTASE